MLEEDNSYVRLEFDDIELGMPLQAPLFDGNREVLFRRGESIATVHQLKSLIQTGLYRIESPVLEMLTTKPGGPAQERRPSVPPRLAPRPAATTATATTSAPPASREAMTSLDATKLRVGDPMYMQSSAEAPRLVIRLIGFLKNKGLIVTVPESESELVMLRDGQSFIVRFFSGQNAYAFTTVVVKQTSVPYPHVHLSYPKEIRGREIRKGSRVDVELIAAIATEPGGSHTASGKIVNLSVGGGALRAKARLGEKDHVINVKFKLMISELPSYVSFDCVIRAVTEEMDPSGVTYLHGLQFIKQDPIMGLALTAFVYQQIVGEA